eukprot:1150727-Pelagomonas_calceolata.AAC.2
MGSKSREPPSPKDERGIDVDRLNPPGIIDNEGGDACARTAQYSHAALTNTTDIATPDARDPFRNSYWLSLKSSHGRNGDPNHSYTAPTHYLNNLTDKLKIHMHIVHCTNAHAHYALHK